MFCTNCGKEVNAEAVVCVHCGFPVKTQKNFCAACGNATAPAQVICTKCGCALQGGASAVQAVPNTKSALVATILSCLIVGVGQMYLGQVAKGVVMLLGAFVLGAVTMGIIAPVIWIISALDAYMVGKRIEDGQNVGDWQFF